MTKVNGGQFVGAIAQSASDGQTVRLPPTLMQPIVSDDVAAALAEIAVAEPLNGTAVNDQTLTPGDNPRIGPTRFEDWLSRSAPRA